MPATSDHPGDFILDVAKVGQKLMTSFTKFITYRKVQDRRLENLYATLSLTATVLTELGTTINKYENDFRVKDEAFRPLCETAKANLGKFLVLINEGISSGVWKNDGKLGGLAFTTEVDPWLLITVSLGGRELAKNYWKSLDDTRDSLLELNDIVKYMILKNISQRTPLDQQQSDEFKNLTALLPHLVHSVEKAEQAKKEEEAFEKARLERMNPGPAPDFFRNDAASDITLFNDQKPRGRRVEIAKNYQTRNRSFDTFDSYESASSVLDTTEVYEEWLLRYNEPVKNRNSSVKVLGISFKRYYEDEGFWGTDAEFRTQDELKEQHHFAAADMSPAKHMEMIQKAIRAIPKKGGVAIEQLLEDRSIASNHEAARTIWEVVAIRPKQKHVYSSAKKWGKDPKETDWLVTIRGEKIDSVERRQPFRRNDPWVRDFGRRDRGRRYRSPPRRMYEPERIYERERSFSPNRRVSTFHPPPRTLSPPRRGGTMEAIPDEGFRPGTLVVGKIPSQEEAEKKMDEIWERMTSKGTDDIFAE